MDGDTMKRFLEACAALPPPGTGCHPAILGAANYGIMAGLSDSEIFAGIRQGIKPGARKVPDKEINDAIAKARKTITAMPYSGNYPQEPLGWDDPIPAELPRQQQQPRFNTPAENLQVIRQEYLDDAPIKVPGEEWNQSEEIIKYLQACFRPDEKPCVCIDVYQHEDGKFSPSGTGSCQRTVAHLVERLKKFGNDIGAVFGDWNAEAGAWIVVNPTNGQGRNNEHITRYANTLIESDRLPPARQLAIIRKLELPCAAIVHSGGKSIHAVVRVDAINQKEYQERVDYIHQVCKANGLEPDSANRNASRLTRLPGITRGQNKQFLIDTDCGKKSFQDWKDYIEELNDDLPEIESMADLISNPPPLSTPLIHNVLRQKHKMLLAGPSKAGKSYLLMQLAIAIATGGKWLDWQCTQGNVCYLNLEIDKPSFVQRFRDLAGTALDWRKVDIWHLRGKSMPMDKLTPKLIRRCRERQYAAIIIDPIYKVITGDENAADQMAKFCNYFDQVAESLGCAMIYCHHHSKGDQWQKRSMDRASGSGVFARDPDAIVDMIELYVDEQQREVAAEKWALDALCEAMDLHDKHWRESFPDEVTHRNLLPYAVKTLGEYARNLSAVAWTAATEATAYRIEGTLREFKNFKPVHIWHRWPSHQVDDTGVLADARAPGEPAKTKKEREAKKKNEEDTRLNDFVLAFETLAKDGKVKLETLAADCCVSRRTVERWIAKDGKRLGMRLNNGYAERNPNAY